MSDDRWRQSERRPRRLREFGGPLFADEPRRSRRRATTRASAACSFGPNDTGPLPALDRSAHRRDPPRRRPPPPVDDDDDDDVDVWSSFTTESPVWRDDEPVTTVMDQVSADPRRDPSGAVDRSGSPYARRPTAAVASTGHAIRRAASTSQAATTPATAARATARRPVRSRAAAVRPQPARFRSPHAASPAASRSAPIRRACHAARPSPGAAAAAAEPAQRRPAGAGAHAARRRHATCRRADRRRLVLAAVFLAALMIKPVRRADRHLRRHRRSPPSSSSTRSPRRATARPSSPGIAACVAAPLAAYWIGERRAAARDRVRVHGRRDRVHRRPQRRGRPAAEHGRSPRSASSGSACSARSRR